MRFKLHIIQIIISLLIWCSLIYAGEVFLLDQDGNKIEVDSFIGKPLVMAFLYTRCPSPTKCPLIMSRVVKLQKELADYKDEINFSIVTIDPGYDTPKVLKEYGEINGADFSNFKLLTGTKEDIDKVIKKFKIYIEEEEPGIYAHSLDTFLMDSKGVIHKVYPGAFWEVEVVADDIVKLMEEEKKPQVSIPSFAGTIKGTVIAKTIRSPRDAVVYIKNIPGKDFSPLPEHAVMDQKGLTFIPHVLPVLRGTTVDFLNSDTVAHNVFTPSETGDKFNLGTWQRDVVKSYTFNKLGVVELLCNLHPDMSAFIIVLNNPYFAITQKDGNFIIKDVPAGRYTLNLWHERVKPVIKDVDVSEAGEIEVNFEDI